MEKKEPQSKMMMLILALFVGSLGIHRLLMGYEKWWLMLVVSVLTFGIGGYIWALYDVVMIATDKMTMADGTPLTS